VKGPERRAAIEEHTLPDEASRPYGIAAGPDGALWFTEYQGNKIGRISTDGSIEEYPLPTPEAGPFGITAGPDGALWFAEEAGKIGHLVPA
jgi:virginiamycin B lyase